MRAIILSFALFGLCGCEKPEKREAKQIDATGSRTTESAAADFKKRVEDLKNAKLDGSVFSEVKHDVVRTNSITSPLKAQVSFKQTSTVETEPSVYDITLYAHFTEGAWHYDRVKGTLKTQGAEIEIEGDSFKIQSAYCYVKILRLKHDDWRHPELK